MTGPTRRRAERAVSKEGMTVVAFGLTVLMIAVTGGLLMQTGEDLDDEGPILTASAGPIDSSNEPTGQWLTLKHETGQTVAVSNLLINVSFSDHPKRASLHGLPTDRLRQVDYDGNHVFTLGSGGVDGAATRAGNDDRWAAGERIRVRFEERRLDLEPDERVEVSVRHVGEDQIVFSDTVSVT